MAFNVGAIEGTLTLDRTPFQDSLKAARALADEFEQRHIAAVLELNTGAATAELDRLTGRLDEYDGRKASAEVDVRTGEADAEIEATDKALDRVDHRTVSPRVNAGGMHSLLSIALALTPAMSSLGIVGAGALGGIGAAAVPAVAGIVGFSVLAKPALEQVMKAADGNAKALAGLDPALRPAVAQAKAAKVEFQGLQAALAPRLIPVFTGALSLGLQVLNLLHPAIVGTANAFKGLEQDASGALDSPFWKRFFDWVGREAGPAITTFGHVLGNLAHGFAGLLMAFQPIVGPMESGLVRISAGFAHWGQTVGQTQGFQNFIAYVRQNGPLLLRTLADVGKAALAIGAAFAMAGPSTLKLIDTFARMILSFQQAHPQLFTLIVNMTAWGVLVGRLVSPIVSLATGLSRFIGFIPAAISGVEAFGIAIGVSLWELTLIVAAIAAVIAIGVLLVTHWKDVKKFTIQTWHDIEHEARTIWHAITSFIRSTVSDVRDWLASTWHTISSTASAVFHGMIDVITFPMRTAIHIISSLWSGAFDFITGIWGDLIHAASRAWGTIKDTIGNLISGAVTTVKNYASHFLQAGIDLVQGLIDGIGRMASRLWSWVKHLADGVINSFKNALGIGSPSKVFREHGVNIVQGLINGITTMTPAAVLAARRLADGVNGAMVAPAAMAGVPVGSTTIAPPTMSPAEVSATIRAAGAPSMTPGVNVGARGMSGTGVTAMSGTVPGGTAYPAPRVAIENVNVIAPAGHYPDDRVAAAQISQALRNMGG